MGERWRATYQLVMDDNSAPRVNVERAVERILDRYDGITGGHLRLVVDVYEVDGEATPFELDEQAEAQERLGVRN